MLILLVILIVERVLLVCFYSRWYNYIMASNLQKIVTFSTTEVEYVVATEAGK